MSEKRKKSVINRRKWLTLEKKLDIIKSHENGKTYAKIARENGMNESSIRSIVRKKDQYKRQAVSTASLLSKVVTRQRSSLINTMEKCLISWIEDCNRKRIQLTESEIQKKALTLFNELKENVVGETSEKFSASRGWFFRFKNRVNLQNCVISGEKLTANKEAAEKFSTDFTLLVQDEGYSHHQIFNVEETMLYWKKIPSPTFLSECEKPQQGPKPSKDGLTLLLGGNASGDFKLRPLVIFRAETPSALRDCEKSSLPVIWRSNKKAWLNREIFEDWLKNYFAPTVETYCHNRGLEFKVLLLLDSASSREISFSSRTIKVVFMPANTAPIVQPMSQGIFPYLKACYLRQVLSQAVEASRFENFSMQTCWLNYNIRNAIDNVSASWNEISSRDLSSSWHKLLPIEAKDLEQDTEAVVRDIVTLGHYLGLQDIDIQIVQKYIGSRVVLSTESEASEIEQVICKEETQDEQDYKQECDRKMDTDDLGKILEGIDMVCETILTSDLNAERSNKVSQVLQNGVQCYRNLYLERQKNKMVL